MKNQITLYNDNIGGTVINYFMHCKRECYLYLHSILSYQKHGLLEIGRYYHDEFEKNEDYINGIKIDKIDKNYVTEYKKKDSDRDAAYWQLIYYLYKLKQIEIIRKGILKYKESHREEVIELDEEKEKMIIKIIKEACQLANSEEIPKVLHSKKCYRCAYYEFCYS